MRNLALSFLTLLVSSTASAQVKPLKEDLLKLLELLPVACASSDEAKAKYADASGSCSSAKVTAAFDQAVQARMAARMAAGGGMLASQEALMKKMQDPAFQQEMQKMTPEQLIALSTQLQGGGLPTSGIPSAAETAMAEEFERINQDVMDFAMNYTREWAETQNALEVRKRAIEEARWEEVKKCPKETSGEVTFTSPACCAAVEKKYDAQWRDAATEWLPQANDIVARYRAAIKARYAEAEKRMAALAYGDKCGVQMFYDMITTTQSQILSVLEAMGTMAGQTWQLACENAVGVENAMICP